MVIITVNGHPVNFLQPIDKVQSLVIIQQRFPIPVPIEYLMPIAQWVYDLTQKAEHIMYNNIIMTKDQIISPTEIMQRRQGQ